MPTATFSPLASPDAPYACIGPAGAPGWTDAWARKRLGDFAAAADHAQPGGACTPAGGAPCEPGRKRQRPDTQRSAPMEPPDYIFSGPPGSAAAGDDADGGGFARLGSWFDPAAPAPPSP